MNAPTTQLPVLITSLRAAKRMEDEAREQRLAIEKQILLHYPEKTEGSIADKTHGISITYGLTRKVDSEALKDAWTTLSENVQKAFEWEAKVVTKTLKAIQDLDQAGYSQLCKFISTTPKKPSVTLKENHGI